MKLQCGILYRDGRAASGLDLATVLGQFNGWNAETSGEFVDGPLAMVYRGDRVTVEEGHEVQPVLCGPYRITWDGRLDNRAEVAARIGIRVDQNVSDAGLVAKAYAALGKSLLGDLIGEFALSAWCDDTQELIFARSVCGSRPLYYVVDKEKIVWSSDFAHLVRVTSLDLAINHTYIIEYLFAQPSGRRTPLKHVEVVPPGNMVRFERSSSGQAKPIWSWEHVKPVRYSRDEEYEEHFRNLMREAVEARMRTRGAFLSEMSGGFDSSTIVLIADQLLRARGQDVGRLKTLSCVYEESESCDESRFIQAVERWRATKSIYVHEHEQEPTLGLREVEFTGIPNPLHSFPGRYRRFAALARAHGANLLLTGNGGDHLFWSDCDGSPLVADELLRAKVWEAHRLCKCWSRITGTPYPRLMFGLAIPLALDSLGLRSRDYIAPRIPAWLAKKYRPEMRAMLRDSVAHKCSAGTPSERTQRRLAEDLFATTAAGYYSEFRSLYISHVYTHRPLVEFCVSVPLSQFVRNGQMRSLMRRAMRDLLPPELLKRRGKQPLDEALMRAFAREWSDIGDIRKWLLCEQGFATPRALSESLERLRLGVGTIEEQPIRVLTAERWLRSLESVKRGIAPFRPDPKMLSDHSRLAVPTGNTNFSHSGTVRGQRPNAGFLS